MHIGSAYQYKMLKRVAGTVVSLGPPVVLATLERRSRCLAMVPVVP